ncbi:2-hydroxychromene-2-carboxylate isomerase [Polaromonas vacuolata]|uniref:2-hydroxychromene-2-carboxylate isomerase n=1 Tax=Polaromonas vacuolata TaxID=37448 RepID=A0A6H2HBF5_9BURK|nr:2-hydroxychromene-2-carboxylate isomerase [Polaromonas vacuolata]QJC57097.1 2-hydroxychromene-2-carboxylate isomerase [Polaromonas vacuolata]
MIEFYFDCSSPWTFIAFKNLQPMAEELGVQVEWKPVLVGGIFNTVNPGAYAAREDMNSAKNRYILKDVQDNARESDLKIVFPPKVFPVNSVKAMRGCLWIAQDADAKPHFLAFVEAVFSAYFSREEDISNDAVLTDICRACGIDDVAFHAGITQPAIKAALKANTDEAIARGAFGAPTIFVGDDMYFGNDRLALVRSAVLRSQAAAQTPA